MTQRDGGHELRGAAAARVADSMREWREGRASARETLAERRSQFVARRAEEKAAAESAAAEAATAHGAEGSGDENAAA